MKNQVDLATFRYYNDGKPIGHFGMGILLGKGIEHPTTKKATENSSTIINKIFDLRMSYLRTKSF